MVTKIKDDRMFGEVRELQHGKVEKLNLQLALDKYKVPVIIFEDWTSGKTKELVRMHLKEAIELKSTIDNLLIDWISFNHDENETKIEDMQHELSKKNN